MMSAVRVRNATSLIHEVMPLARPVPDEYRCRLIDAAMRWGSPVLFLDTVDQAHELYFQERLMNCFWSIQNADEWPYHTNNTIPACWLYIMCLVDTTSPRRKVSDIIITDEFFNIQTITGNIGGRHQPVLWTLREVTRISKELEHLRILAQDG